MPGGPHNLILGKNIKPENTYSACFANILKKFKSQNMKVAQVENQKNLAQFNNENWMDASFDQNCSTISKIDQ